MAVVGEHESSSYIDLTPKTLQAQEPRAIIYLVSCSKSMSSMLQADNPRALRT